MKKYWVGMFLALFLMGCTEATPYGPCRGITEDGDPHLKYEVSPGNVLAGFVFWETGIVPVVVALQEFKCPVAIREKSQP